MKKLIVVLMFALTLSAMASLSGPPVEKKIIVDSNNFFRSEIIYVVIDHGKSGTEKFAIVAPANPDLSRFVMATPIKEIVSLPVGGRFYFRASDPTNKLPNLKNLLRIIPSE